MRIDIHMIQNHSYSNLNRDDLGVPKTCYFGGVLRSRISSQCLKRSIRKSKAFEKLLGGIRTRQLAKIISDEMDEQELKKRTENILKNLGLKPKKEKKEESDLEDPKKSKMLVYTTRQAIGEMIELMKNESAKSDKELEREFGKLISKRVAVPDLALNGRMLETGKIQNTIVEAALQVSHAFSTHVARPEVDYFVAADDIPGEDAGAGYLDEAVFASACFYKYFSIDWKQLLKNLKSYGKDHEKLSAHTVGAFIKGAATTTPTGKQNSSAAHNKPDGILIEIRNSPINYSNAFAEPVNIDCRDIISQSIAQFGQYVFDLEIGFGEPEERFWFSPNLRYPLKIIENKKERKLSKNNYKSLNELIESVIKALGYDWEDVQKIYLKPEARAEVGQ